MAPLRVACEIPTYNGRKDLERLLDTLAKQTANFDKMNV
ncbi:glycosyltransferase family A protein, partial [Pseudomonas syringae pv. tagetis]